MTAVLVVTGPALWEGVLGSARHKAADQGSWPAMTTPLEIGQGVFGVRARALELEEEDGQGAKQGEIACRRGVSDGATVLVLGAVPPVVLAVFDSPVAANQIPQTIGVGLLGPEGRQGKSGLVGFLDHLAAAQGLDFAVDPQDLRRTGQTEGGGGDGLAPQVTPLDPPVALVQTAGLRGETCRAAVARLWPEPKVGWL